MIPRSPACMDPRGMTDRIYKENYYALLQTKYKSSGAHGLREEDILCWRLKVLEKKIFSKGGQITPNFVKHTLLFSCGINIFYRKRYHHWQYMYVHS